MKGAAALAVPAGTTSSDVRPLPPGSELACAICGGKADGFGTKAPNGAGGIFKETFTDRDLLSNYGPGICVPCATLASWARGYKGPKGPDGLNPLQPPGARPFLLADGEVRRIPHGIVGLKELSVLSDRSEPFAVIAGWWSNAHHYWIKAPVAYPAPTWPALYVVDGQAQIVWVHRRAIDDLIAGGEPAGDNDPRKSAPDDPRDIRLLKGVLFADPSRRKSDRKK